MINDPLNVDIFVIWLNFIINNISVRTNKSILQYNKTTNLFFEYVWSCRFLIFTDIFCLQPNILEGIKWENLFCSHYYANTIVNIKNKVELGGHAFRKWKELFTIMVFHDLLKRVFVVHNLCWSWARSALIPRGLCDPVFSKVRNMLKP